LAGNLSISKNFGGKDFKAAILDLPVKLDFEDDTHTGTSDTISYDIIAKHVRYEKIIALIIFFNENFKFVMVPGFHKCINNEEVMHVLFFYVFPLDFIRI
jgi:hypothetical protein